MIPSKPANAKPPNSLTPNSFGFIVIARDVSFPGGNAPDFSYDNLYYPDGSSQTASSLDYGVGVMDGADVLDYLGGVTAVPEPAAWRSLVNEPYDSDVGNP